MSPEILTPEKVAEILARAEAAIKPPSTVMKFLSFARLVPALCRSHAELQRQNAELLEALKRQKEELRLIRMKDCDRVYDITLRFDVDALLAKFGGVE